MLLRIAVAALLATTLASVAAIPYQSVFKIPVASASANTNCNKNQTDNTWIQRTQSNSYVGSVTAYISYFDYNLCIVDPNPAFWPFVSSSAAWVGIVSSNYGSDIMQVGYIKCGTAQLAGCGNFNSSQLGVTMAFWAWGVNGDPFHQPWPWPLAYITVGGDHLFRVFKVNRTSCYWALTMDQGTPGYVYTTVPCASIPWTPTVAYVANEVWNSGDQLGGYSGTPQRFKSESFADASGHTLYFQQPPGKVGHCYPQAAFSNSSGQGDDWRSWTYVAAHSPC
jgi:hypothetical protein